MTIGGISFDGYCFTTQAVTPGAIAASSASEVTVTMSGVRSTDFVVTCTKPTLTAGIDIGNARVSAANTIKITFQNSTSASITPATETYTFLLARPEKVIGGPDALSGGAVVFN